MLLLFAELVVVAPCVTSVIGSAVATAAADAVAADPVSAANIIDIMLMSKRLFMWRKHLFILHRQAFIRGRTDRSACASFLP